ncbi:hypothetical protein FRB99_007585 [Tulasnella sp. 403]|nr:hypothetical protein FRB99_007585 [Tulasnella sp. 403]
MLQPGVDPLDFSDIFSFSVSPHLRDNHMNLDLPAQPTSTEGAGGVEEDTFEPPDAAEIQQMREKLFAMGIVDPATSTSKDSITRSIDIGQRERQLAEMVLRLTHPSLHPQPSQLIEQAATISQLTRQRDFLIQCHQEEREFWEAERESWVRIAGALTARRLNDGSHRTDIVERDNLNLMSDNRLLKMKLQEQQSRVENLEMELRMLRPLLLLRPASPPRNTGQPTSTRPAGRPRKAKEKDQSRFSDDDLDLHHAKRGHNPLKYASTGDARSEHLLLATRKLGKQKITSLLPSAAFPQGSSGSLGIAFNPARPNGVTPTVAPPPHPQSPQISQSVPSASLQVPTTSRSVSGPTTRPTQPSTPGASLGALARHHSTLTPRTPRQGRRISPQRVSRANPDKLVTPSHPHTATIPGSNTPSALDHLIQASRILGANGGGEESPSHSSVDGSPLKRRRVEEGSPNEGRGEASSSTG